MPACARQWLVTAVCEGAGEGACGTAGVTGCAMVAGAATARRTTEWREVRRGSIELARRAATHSMPSPARAQVRAFRVRFGGGIGSVTGPSGSGAGGGNVTTGCLRGTLATLRMSSTTSFCGVILLSALVGAGSGTLAEGAARVSGAGTGGGGGPLIVTFFDASTSAAFGAGSGGGLLAVTALLTGITGWSGGASPFFLGSGGGGATPGIVTWMSPGGGRVVLSWTTNRAALKCGRCSAWGALSSETVVDPPFSGEGRGGSSIPFREWMPEVVVRSGGGGGGVAWRLVGTGRVAPVGGGVTSVMGASPPCCIVSGHGWTVERSSSYARPSSILRSRARRSAPG